MFESHSMDIHNDDLNLKNVGLDIGIMKGIIKHCEHRMQTGINIYHSEIVRKYHNISC